MCAEELSIKTPYLQLKARAWGPKDGLPVLALHGWMDNANSFAPLAPFMENIRLVALDLPGQGFSQWRPPGSHYHFVDFCNEVMFSADALGWTQFSILGHSFGGAVAMVSACMVPERIQQLALIDNFGPRVDTGVNTTQRLRHAFRDFNSQINKKLSFFKQYKDALRARQLVSDLDVEQIECLLERGLKKLDDGYTWSSDPQLKMTSPIYIHEQQLLSFLQHLVTPTQLIRAQSGYLLNRKDLEQRYAIVKNLQIIDMSGGHHIHMEIPQKVAKCLNQFFHRNAKESGTHVR